MEKAVIEALECCDISDCEKCIYHQTPLPQCRELLSQDALCLINSLIKTNKKLKTEVIFLKEKDRKNDEQLHQRLKAEWFEKGIAWALDEAIARINEIKEEQL